MMVMLANVINNLDLLFIQRSVESTLIFIDKG